MKVRKSFSVKYKIYAYLLSFCAILLLILWLFQVVFLDNIYMFIRTNEVEKAAALVIKNIESEDLENIILSLSHNDEIFVSYDKTQEHLPKRINYEKDQKKNPRSVCIVKEVVLSNGFVKTITFDAIISPVNATVNTLRYQLYCISAFMIVFSLFLAFAIAKRISLPIEKINSSAKLLAKGNYETHFNASGYKEIQELSDTLNYTAGELSKVENLRRELIANVSHDLRTPLTLISGYAEAMRDLPDEMSTENVQIIIDETKRLTTLVNDVLDIGNIEGSDLINIQDYSLTLNLEHTVERVCELVRSQGYVIDFKYDQQVNITADKTRISQAFYNILINGINYTGDDKLIHVRQITNDNEVRIEVVDSGIGIPTENIPYIWDRYYKATSTHKRAVMGTGLGLSIVKKIIEMHGGNYGVISNENKGSTFWFSLKR